MSRKLFPYRSFAPYRYLEHYYSQVDGENHFLLRFLAEAYKDIEGSKLLEFGGGPTIYSLISAVNKVEEVYFSDYLKKNLSVVSRWKRNGQATFDWSEFFYHALMELKTKAGL